jgi:hypothetical protein
VTGRDRAIRARLAEGEEQSVINLLLYGTTFTSRPRATERELARLQGKATRTEIVQGRIDDLAAALAAPAANERLQFARSWLGRKGINPSSPGGYQEIKRFLDEGLARMDAEIRALETRRASLALKPGDQQIEKATRFRNRGLAPDTTFKPNFGLERTLSAIKAEGLLPVGSVQRVAVVGPGLDFTDKQDGFDFYLLQSIQPFALIDSLERLGLAVPSGVQLTALDLSPMINQHLAAARGRAAVGQAYGLHLPLDLDLRWTDDIVTYWKQFGDQIGRVTTAEGPQAAGPVAVRRVSVRPDVVASVSADDVNIVLQRLEPMPPDARFDLIVATDILIYYDVFEQSLALTNIARMLRPGGLFLTNTQVLEVPGLPLATVGVTDVVYLNFEQQPVGDRFRWLRLQ